MDLNGKCVLLGVSGGIDAHKMDNVKHIASWGQMWRSS